MKFTVKSGKKDVELELSNSATVKDLKVAFSKATKKDIHRLSFKNDTIRLDDDSQPLSKYECKEGTVITFKDLGAQIGYRTVFLGGLLRFDVILPFSYVSLFIPSGIFRSYALCWIVRSSPIICFWR